MRLLGVEGIDFVEGGEGGGGEESARGGVLVEGVVMVGAWETRNSGKRSSLDKKGGGINLEGDDGNSEKWHCHL